VNPEGAIRGKGSKQNWTFLFVNRKQKEGVHIFDIYLEFSGKHLGPFH
jgi:hypothetical protein